MLNKTERLYLKFVKAVKNANKYPTSDQALDAESYTEKNYYAALHSLSKKDRDFWDLWRRELDYEIALKRVKLTSLNAEVMTVKFL